ncbi:hypothetical protein [Parasulfitobacter algicola]|uniref:Uncharacterized protein n=1 Tax=Parasulfitobacter algicola TaxID=2614809 RepID=A0ABX2IU52_9RHOB|nr:hypothetical protein [Sulfitobacter algicola]NSX54367.1 hypothetical protein [Sulfitobacter algicola]
MPILLQTIFFLLLALMPFRWPTLFLWCIAACFLGLGFFQEYLTQTPDISPGAIGKSTVLSWYAVTGWSLFVVTVIQLIRWYPGPGQAALPYRLYLKKVVPPAFGVAMVPTLFMVF